MGNAAKAPGEIERWIESITDLHRSKPPPQVHYKKHMPDIEALMQEWPEKFEAILKDVQLAPVECELTLEEMVRVMCGSWTCPCTTTTTSRACTCSSRCTWSSSRTCTLTRWTRPAPPRRSRRPEGARVLCVGLSRPHIKQQHIVSV